MKEQIHKISTSHLYHFATATFPTSEQSEAILAELKLRLTMAEFNAMIRTMPVSKTLAS